MHPFENEGKMMPTKDIRGTKRERTAFPFFAYKEKVHMKQAIMPGCPAPAHPATIPAWTSGPKRPRKGRIALERHHLGIEFFFVVTSGQQLQGHPACRY